MKNRFITVAMAVVLSMSFAACGEKGNTDTSAEKTEIESEAASEVTSEAASDENTEAVSEQTKEQTSEETSEQTKDSTSTEKTTEDSAASDSKTTDTTASGTTDGFSFADITNKEFCFSSGAGAWATYVYVSEDGSFEGFYHDSDMGDIGEGYEYGTSYSCHFTGKFAEPVKVDDYTYSLKIESISQDSESGKEEIIDNVKVVYSDPYGFNGTDEMYVYLPGTPVSGLSEDFLSWVSMAFTEENQTTLPFYALYNVSEKYGFTSYDTQNTDPYDIGSVVDASYTDITAELAAIEAKYTEIQGSLTEDATQYDYNMNALAQYELWDKELNSLWSRIKAKLDNAAMEKLTSEQKVWISEKEKAVSEAGAEYEGGSIQPMIEDQKAAAVTRERAYVLSEYLK